MKFYNDYKSKNIKRNGAISKKDKEVNKTNSATTLGLQLYNDAKLTLLTAKGTMSCKIKTL